MELKLENALSDKNKKQSMKQMHKDIRSSVSISESKQRANRYHNAHKSIGFFGEEANVGSKTA